jgi:hypothetical protein
VSDETNKPDEPRRAAPIDALYGAVYADTPCAACGYNLRGLPLDAHCPECGAPVAAAIRDDDQAALHPDWLRTLLRGYHFCAAGGAVLMVGVLAGGALAWVSKFGDSAIVPAAMLVCVLAGGAIFWLGLVLFTAQPPRLVAGTGSRLPICIRIGGAISVAAAIFSAALAHSLNTAPHLILQALLGPLGLLGTVVLIMFARYTAWIARRLGDKYVAGRNNQLGVTYGICWGICAMSVMIAIPAREVALPCAFTFGMGLCVGMISGGLLLITTPLMLSERIRQKLRESEKEWGR